MNRFSPLALLLSLPLAAFASGCGEDDAPPYNVNYAAAGSAGVSGGAGAGTPIGAAGINNTAGVTGTLPTTTLPTTTLPTTTLPTTTTPTTTSTTTTLPTTTTPTTTSTTTTGTTTTTTSTTSTGTTTTSTTTTGGGGIPTVKSYALSSLRTSCWFAASDARSVPFAGGGITKVSLKVTTNAGAATPFDFCITAVKVSTATGTYDLEWGTDAWIDGGLNPVTNIQGAWFPFSDTYTTWANPTSVPPSFSGKVAAGGKICVKGTAPQVIGGDYDNYWGAAVGFNLNQLPGSDIANAYTGLTGVEFTLTDATGGALPTSQAAAMRVAIDGADAKEYCANL